MDGLYLYVSVLEAQTKMQPQPKERQGQPIQTGRFDGMPLSLPTW